MCDYVLESESQVRNACILILMSAIKTAVAVLVSGNGSTVEAFIESCQNNQLIDIEVPFVICNNPPSKAGVYERINQLNKKYNLGIKIINVSTKTHPKGKSARGQSDEESKEILRLVKTHGCQLVVLMGYMKVVRGKLLEEFGWKPQYESIYRARLVNTHPAPLPEVIDLFGADASKKVLELGLEQSKHTVHLVSEGVDKGPIIAEHPVRIFADDTKDSLFARVQMVEKATLPYVLDGFLKKTAGTDLIST